LKLSKNDAVTCIRNSLPNFSGSISRKACTSGS
jgi:hypothetical protein